MRKTVEVSWHAYSEPLEGRTLFPYLDVKGLLTVGVGILIDPISLALNLPWFIGNRTATQAEIIANLSALKAHQELKNRYHVHAESFTTIRLTDEGVDALVMRRLRANETYLKKFLPEWEEFSADAQLGILSLCWAVGAGINKTRPALVNAINDRDWIAAKVHARIDSVGNAGVVPRNRNQELCFDNAQTVQERGLPPEWLFWPNITPREETLEEATVKALALVYEGSDS